MAILLIKRAATEEAFRITLGTFVRVDIDLVLRIVVECTVSRYRIVLILQDLAATTELCFAALLIAKRRSFFYDCGTERT